MANEINLWQIVFIDLFGVGNEAVFLFVSFAVILFLAAEFKFPNFITLSIMGVYAILMASFFQSLLPFLFFFVGFIVTQAINKMIGNR